MKKRKVLMAALAAVLAVAMIGGCTAMTGGGERPEAEGGSGEGGSEHGPGGESGGENGGESGEEGGSMLALDETFDEVRKGARLILRYDAGAGAFIGRVENTTSATLEQVRVEVHLSNGVELGPTTPQELAAGKSMDVLLDDEGESFTGWTPHAEVGPQSGGEHGPGGEGGGS